MNGEEIAKILVAEAISRMPDDISLDMRLLHDLEIDGDDAELLLQKMSIEHRVKLDYFNFSEYFGSEYGATWRYFARRLLGKFMDVHKSFKPLTVRAIGEAIDAGVLK